MGINEIKEIVSCIKENISDLKGLEKMSDFEFGELLAYVETLSIIQSACAGYDLKEIELDFDVDNAYL